QRLALSEPENVFDALSGQAGANEARRRRRADQFAMAADVVGVRMRHDGGGHGLGCIKPPTDLGQPDAVFCLRMPRHQSSVEGGGGPSTGPDAKLIRSR